MWLISEFCSPQLQAPDAGVCLRLLLLSPALEECVIRAGLQEWLMRRDTGSGLRPVAVSVVAFSLLHLGSGWPQALAVATPGLALALLYQRTRSWRWCALAHSAMNAFAISVCSL
ncbi:JDVT-CTERM system glutamic-type intramembrane protease MrtJ [Duganella sp. CT11-25]|uniref:JDVT-CTERM system glutamic-type intramembrane protease MrtJ n=1 Tax=unclassified Duganella TaxID=2636909 RepID=UPI0039AEB9DF